MDLLIIINKNTSHLSYLLMFVFCPFETFKCLHDDMVNKMFDFSNKLINLLFFSLIDFLFFLLLLFRSQVKNHSNVNMMVVKDVLQIVRIVKNIHMYIQAINHIIAR